MVPARVLVTADDMATTRGSIALPTPDPGRAAWVSVLVVRPESVFPCDDDSVHLIARLPMAGRQAHVGYIDRAESESFPPDYDDRYDVTDPGPYDGLLRGAMHVEYDHGKTNGFQERAADFGRRADVRL